jgi:hypothetical protein
LRKIKMPKGNPNPSPATRFSADNPGRAKQKGARDRLTANFLTELAESFEQHGRQAIQAVMLLDTPKYLQIVAALVPKLVEVTRTIDEVSDEELAAAISAVTEAIKNSGKLGPAPAAEETPSARTVN